VDCFTKHDQLETQRCQQQHIQQNEDLQHERTLDQVGTALMSFSIGEVSARGPFFTCTPGTTCEPQQGLAGLGLSQQWLACPAWIQP